HVIGQVKFLEIATPTKVTQIDSMSSSPYKINLCMSTLKFGFLLASMWTPIPDGDIFHGLIVLIHKKIHHTILIFLME
ncbi:MAG: hypothetical protein ACTSW8_08520, partial [Candidatus Thorarchaeota archaeon]